ncbi:MAG: discoidin domain-containing protein [Flexilinea sp.]
MRKIKKKSGLVISIVFFLIFFIIGILIYDDYGVSIDEMNQVTAGHVIYKYVSELFKLNNTDFSDLPDIQDYFNRYYGQAVTFPTVILEAIKGFSMDTSTILRVRHLWNFINYYLAVLCFSLLIHKRFSDWKVTITGIVILILSPRIFADAFYNDRDLMFLSWFMITMFLLNCFINKPSICFSILLGISIAISITIRYFGLCFIIPLVIYAFSAGKKGIRKIVVILITCILSWYLLTPVAWENPVSIFTAAIENFVFSHQRLSETNGTGTVLFMGKWVLESDLPWYYLPVWIVITTPTVYTLLFIGGISTFFRGKSKKVFEKNHILDYSQIIILILTLTTIMVFRPVLYDGWRHFYFLYCPIVYFSLYGFSVIVERTSRGIRIGLYMILIVSFLTTGSWMIRNHPYQMVFYNILVRENAAYNFERDYWRLSSKECLDFIVNQDKNLRIDISEFNAVLDVAKYALIKQDRDRLLQVSYGFGGQAAKYIVANYTNTIGNELKFPFYTPIYHIRVNQMKIASVFQRDHQNELWAQDIMDSISSNINQNSLQNIYDGDLSTGWTTGKLQNNEDYLDLQFKDYFTLNGLTIYIGENENERPWSLKLFSSKDGLSWTPIEIINQRYIDYSINDVKTKYLRIMNSEPSDKYSWSIYELLFHGKKVNY